MSDLTSGIKNIIPSYPVKPVQPIRKDRESGKRENDRRNSEPKTETEKRDDDKPAIDEYI